MINFFLLTGSQKVNGTAVPITLRNRPRIPTPDVTKEVIDREHRLSNMGMTHSGHMGVTLMQQGYQNEVPVLGALVLSPIQELDSGSVNNTLHAGQPGTAALAQAVLSPALSSAGISPMLTSSPVVSSMALAPMNVTQLSSLCNGSTPSTPRTERLSTPTSPRATVTELSNSGSDRDSEHGSTSHKSSPTSSNKQRSRKTSADSKRGEVYV